MTWPTVLHFNSSLPGQGGDSAIFAWNLWWFDHSTINPEKSVFETRMIFHPLKNSLAFHTLCLFNSALTFSVRNYMTIQARYNLILFFTFCVSGIGVYLFARETGASKTGALLAGFIFTFAPFRSARALGHINLLSTEFIPFFLLFFRRTLLKKQSIVNTFLAAFFLGLTAYCSYYYAFFLFIIILFSFLNFPLLKSLTPHKSKFDLWAFIFALLSIGLCAIPLFTNGIRWEIGPATLRLSSFRGPQRLLLVALILKIFSYTTYLIRRKKAWKNYTEALVSILVITSLFVIFILPLSAAMLKALSNQSDAFFKKDYYLSLYYSLDASVFFIPSPQHCLLHFWTHPFYQKLGGGIEQSGFIGYIAIIFSLLGFLLHRRKKTEIRFMAWMVLTFLLLSLGPLLKFKGEILTGGNPKDFFILPFHFFLKIPILWGLRIPSRFIVIAVFYISILAGLGWTAWEKRKSYRQIYAAIAIILIILEYCTIPYPMEKKEKPSTYEKIRNDATEKAILEIPLGFYSGARLLGIANSGAQFRQIFHRHAIIGGHVSRIPPWKLDYFRRIPLIQAVLYLQDEKKALTPPEYFLTAEPENLVETLKRNAFFLNLGYIIVRKDIMPPDVIPGLRGLIKDILNFKLIKEDEKAEIWKSAETEPGNQTICRFPAHPLQNYLCLNPYFEVRDDSEGKYVYPLKNEMTFLLPVGSEPINSISLELKYLNEKPGSFANLNAFLEDELIGRTHVYDRWTEIEFNVRPDVKGRHLRLTWSSGNAEFMKTKLGHLDIQKRLLVFSSHLSAGLKPFIRKDSKDMIRPKRGYNLVVLSPDTLEATKSGSFFQNIWEGEIEGLIDFIEAIPSGHIVMMCYWDDSDCKLFQELAQALQQLGGTVNPWTYKFGCYSMIGIKDSPPGTAIERFDQVFAFVETQPDSVGIRKMCVE